MVSRGHQAERTAGELDETTHLGGGRRPCRGVPVDRLPGGERPDHGDPGHPRRGDAGGERAGLRPQRGGTQPGHPADQLGRAGRLGAPEPGLLRRPDVLHRDPLGQHRAGGRQHAGRAVAGRVAGEPRPRGDLCRRRPRGRCHARVESRRRPAARRTHPAARPGRLLRQAGGAGRHTVRGQRQRGRRRRRRTAPAGAGETAEATSPGSPARSRCASSWPTIPTWTRCSPPTT